MQKNPKFFHLKIDFMDEKNVIENRVDSNRSEPDLPDETIII